MKLSEFQFVDQPYSSLHCPVCLKIYEQPMMINTCGHTFCLSCISQTMDLDSKCPLCRTVTRKSDLKTNLTVQSVICELRVYCVNKEAGCSHISAVDALDQHVSICIYRTVQCPYLPFGCNYTCAKVHMESHLKQCTYEALKPFLFFCHNQIVALEARVNRQARELERLREFVRTNKTDPSVPSPDSPRLQPSGLSSAVSPISLSPPASANVPEAAAHRWVDGPLVCTSTIKAHLCGVTALSIRDQFVYSGAYDGSIKVFDLDTCTSSPDTSSPLVSIQAHAHTIWSMAVSEEHSLLYSGGSDRILKAWDISDPSSLSLVKEAPGHTGKVYSLLHEGLALFSASSDGSIVIRDSLTLESRGSLVGHVDNVNGLASTTDSRQIVSGGSDKTVRVWDVETQKAVMQFTCENTEVLDVTHGNSLIYASTYDAIIYAFDPRSPDRAIAQLAGHNWEVWQVEYHMGYLFSGSFDHKIRKWDPRAMACVEVLAGHRGYVHGLKFGDDKLVSACADKTIKIWSCSSE
eukprot:Partr_v1_DN26929_c0_g1_i2_m7196 putative WD domain, G-beta repeat